MSRLSSARAGHMPWPGSRYSETQVRRQPLSTRQATSDEKKALGRAVSGRAENGGLGLRYSETQVNSRPSRGKPGARPEHEDSSLTTRQLSWGRRLFCGFAESNQVTSVIEYNNGTSTTLNFAYDSNGNRTLETDSLGGTVSSVYDADNELVTEIYSQTGGAGMEIQQDYNW